MGLSKQAAHRGILDRLYGIYLIKNAKYGDSTTDTFKKFGIVSYAVRLNDKLRRFQALALSPTGEEGTDDESMIDTLLDLANYAILAVMDIEDATQKGQMTVEPLHNM